MFDLRRRQFITLLGGAAAAWPLAARGAAGGDGSVKSPNVAPSRSSTRPQVDCRGGATNEVTPESKE